MAEPLDPLAAAYLESLAGKAPGTFDAYRRALRHFLAWLQERPGSGVSFDPTTFTRTAAQVYFAELEARGQYAKATSGATRPRRAPRTRKSLAPGIKTC